jgi:hypothetical protein
MPQQRRQMRDAKAHRQWPQSRKRGIARLAHAASTSRSSVRAGGRFSSMSGKFVRRKCEAQ